MYFICNISLFSEELKEAVSVKTQSLQMLQDENNKLTQELDGSHKGQSDLVKVQRFYFKKPYVNLQASEHFVSVIDLLIMIWI